MAKKQFKSESKRLLEMMINSIYTNKEIFLREIISNASDALDKRHYLSLTAQDHKVAKKDLEIRIITDKDNRTLTIIDTGIGMNKEELETNLGTIAKSGSKEFQEQLEKATKNIDIIGQFGVGFYSAFMVAKKITVESHSALSEESYAWISSGEDGYTINKCDDIPVGTRITLELKDDTDEVKYSQYLEEYTIKSLIGKYSDYVRYPIKMNTVKSIPDPTDDNKTIDTVEEETLNSMIPLWKKQKSKIKDEEYNEFYKAKFSDWEDPLKVIHYNVEGNVSYTALLFIPSRAPYDFYYQSYEAGLQLYSKGVFILDKAKDLLPDHYRFVVGLIDSDDLSLNISRELLQQDHQVKLLAKSIEKKIHSALEDMLKNDRDKYEKFFENFGLNLKYGVYSSYGLHKDELQDLLLFTSNKDNKLVTLDEYVSRMPKKQEKIYYACAKSIEEIERLPILSKLKKKKYEVLYFLDERDEFVAQVLHTYKDKDFQNITSAELDLDSEEEKKEKEEVTKQNEDLLKDIKEALNGKVENVVISSRLVDDPVCIVAEEGLSLEMEKYLKNDPMYQEGMKAKKILEINPKHELFEKLQKMYKKDKDSTKDIALVLYNQALLIQGLPVEDPVNFTKKITELIINKK